MVHSGPEHDLGDTLWFASLAYLLVLLPWTIAFAHDFISEKWATIADTRKLGAYHVIVIFVVMPVILAYIVSQPRSSEPDYKEMYTALTALLVGSYHLSRSLVGLIQLCWFQDWATTIVILMEQGGYDCKLQRFNEQIQTRKQRRSLPQVLTSMLYKLREFLRYHKKRDDWKRVSKTVLTMGVNNSIIDNEFTSSKSPNVAFSLEHWIVNLFGRRMDPVEAKFTTLVRWSVAFLSQFGDKWLKDVSGTALLEKGLRRAQKRREFAVQVLAAATLRMGRTEVKDDENPFSFCGLDLGSQKSNLPPNAWQQINKRSEDLVFSRQEFATVSFGTQVHMPGKTPVLPLVDESHPQAQRERYARLERGFLDPIITEARSSLHPTLHEYLEKHESFSALHLEWFAAFLWTQSRIHGDTRKKRLKWFSKSSKQGGSNDINFFTENWKRKEDLPDDNDTAVRLLRSQLGFEDSIPCRTFYYPFLKGAYERRFWENRAILAVSARIDNWMSICGGRQVSFLRQKEPYWTTDKFWSAHGDSKDRYPRARSGSSDSSKSGKRHEESEDLSFKKQSQKIFKYHQELEIRSLKYQLTKIHTNNWHMEHGLTFLGCIIESVRSLLAEQVYLKGCELDSWCPELPRETITFFPSKELCDCIDSEQKVDSAIQERLLWECQQGVYFALRKKVEQTVVRGSIAIQRELEMMLLFIMGFPSIEVTQRWPKQRNFCIRPVLAPQPLEVSVVLYTGKVSAYGSSKPTAVLRIETWSEEGLNLTIPTQFWWRDWRDAFEGRLAGRFQWQEQHFLPAYPIQKGDRKSERHETLAKPTEPLAGNAEWEKPPRVWSGWKPFRRGMALFELKHLLSSSENEDTVDLDEIIHGDQTKLLKRQASATKTYRDVRITKPASLSAAMLRLDTLLGHRERIDNVDQALIQKTLGVDTEQKRKVKSSPPPKSVIQLFFKSIGQDDHEDPPENSGRRSTADLSKEVKDLVNDAREFKPRAMHRLADGLDKINFSSPDLVFQLMQSALHIDRQTETAEFVIDKLLTGSANLRAQNRQEKIDKARYSVELLWLDVEAKHRKVWKRHARAMTKEEVLEWKQGIKNEEKQRMGQIINLHLRVVKENPTGTMLRGLAERISKWGNTQRQEDRAVELYESAMIGNADPDPMIRLAVLHASRNFANNNVDYAHDLLKRALHVAKSGPHDRVMSGANLPIKSGGDVLKLLYEMTVSDRGAHRLHIEHVKFLREMGKLGDNDAQTLLEKHLKFLQERAKSGVQSASQFLVNDQEGRQETLHEDDYLEIKTLR